MNHNHDNNNRLDEITVSAIVPAYKTELYLDTFLELVSEQTIFPHLEVILDLNKPSEEELKITEKHQIRLGRHLVVLINQELKSISASMNNAIVNSHGKYIAIWNVDDLRTPDSLEKQAQILDSDHSISCATGNYQKVTAFRERQGSVVRENDLSPSKVLSGMHLGPFLMFPKVLTEKIGFFDEQLRSGGDFDFAVRLARAGKIASTDSLLGWYLDAGLGASTRPNSLQPIERTLIEMRYGIFHKLDMRFVPTIYPYSIPRLEFFGKSHSIENYFHNYNEYMSDRLQIFLREFNPQKTNLLRRIARKVSNGLRLSR
jgi:glycosyltransferase involved in cell wall biosynthesis